jgi:RNA polymerase sigma factor for flagellar operon FliA
MNNPVAELPFAAIKSASGCAVWRPKRRKAAAMPANGPSQHLHVVSARGDTGDLAATAPTSSSAYEALLVSNLHVVESIVRFTCQRQRLGAVEAEEFASDVKLRLIDNDYDILRRFRQQSSLRTYLTVVIQRMFLDYRNRLWGKWRPSAEAVRLGSIGVRLERLLARDGYGFDHACEILWTNEGVALKRSELADIAARLPLRTRPVLIGEEALERMPQEPAVDADIASTSSEAAGLHVQQALAPAVRALADQDRLILRLRFQEGLAVSDIARALHLDQKPLYRRFERLLQRLRDVLEAAGIDRAAALELVSGKEVDIGLSLLESGADIPASTASPVATGI